MLLFCRPYFLHFLGDNLEGIQILPEPANFKSIELTPIKQMVLSKRRHSGSLDGDGDGDGERHETRIESTNNRLSCIRGQNQMELNQTFSPCLFFGYFVCISFAFSVVVSKPHDPY